ncbi:MAG: hypothetical protein DRP45_03345 [Candidatus Zixiibacteriota bacterium]|nr:MAG: hypothetical protein DRP45_03345 [candidate division Zixibacteria bacterium]
MRASVAILVFILLTVSPTQAEFPNYPDYSLLWNSFSSVRVTNGYALATTDFGLLVMEYNTVNEQYEPVRHLELETQPFTSKLDGNVLSIRSYADIIYFVDVSHLPQVNLLGQANIGCDFYDFTLSGQNLYLAVGFEGVKRYELTDYNEPQYRDSSMIGIHCTQIESEGNRFLVLDNYNGILRYKTKPGKFGDFLDWLWIPRRAHSFSQSGSSVVIALENEQKVYFGSYAQPQPGITDSVQLLGLPHRVFCIDTLLVSLDPEAGLMEVFSTNSLSEWVVVLPEYVSEYFDGDAFVRNHDSHLLLPNTSGGLSEYNLDRIWFDPAPSDAYARAGPVAGICLHNEHLITGGGSNPLELFDLSNGDPVRNASITGFGSVGVMTKMDSLFFVVYPDIERILSFTLSQDSLWPVNSATTDGSAISALRPYPGETDESLSAFLAIKESAVDFYIVAPESDMWRASSTDAFGTILDAIVVDSFLVLSTDRHQLDVYQLYEHFGTEFRWNVGCYDNLNCLVEIPARLSTMGDTLPNMLLGFGSRDMFKITLPPETSPSVEHLGVLPIDVTSASIAGDRLYTIGSLGLGVFDLSTTEPALVNYGGYGGNLVACDGTTLVTSGGTAVHLYALEDSSGETYVEITQLIPENPYFLQNYPNPFNPLTNIEYTLSSPARVRLEVLNILGQHVATLVDGLQAQGEHVVEWNGNSSNGRHVTSGVYFYRLTTPEGSTTRKMTLLK